MTQPWCGLVASEIKRIENRPRSMIRRADFGEPFALHASREIDESVYDRIEEIDPRLRLLPSIMTCTSLSSVVAPAWYRLSRVTSAVIAVATIDAVVVDRRCGAAGVDDDGHCRRCGLMPVNDDGTEKCPPGFFDSSWLSASDLGDQRRWFFGPVGYVLRDVRALAVPVPCRGWQGFWTLPVDVERAVVAQVEAVTDSESLIEGAGKLGRAGRLT